MSDSNQDLLHTPEGLWDHYGRDLREIETVEDSILGTFHSFGFEDIKTPAFEFFDVFSKEVGTKPSRELYKFFDKDGSTLVLRPDFTPSVARCAAKYFMDDTRPLRFCYEGSVFANTTSLQGKLHESTQMGAELINDDSLYADAEMLAMLIGSLRKAGLSRFQVTVGNVEYFKGICEAAGIGGETELALREYISSKNYYAAEDLLKSRNIAPKYQETFLRITNFMKTDEDLKGVLVSAPNSRAAKAIERLIDLYRVLADYGVTDYISFDLSLLSKYRYYTGIIFKGYTYGVGDAIAAGGRYDSLLSHFGKDAPAIGFAVMIDSLMEALRSQKVSVPEGEPVETLTYTPATFAAKLREAGRLRSEGRRVQLVRG